MINNKEIASKFNELNIKLRDAINDQPVSDDKTIKETIDKILELLSQNVIEGLSLRNLTDICNDLELEEAWAKGRGLNDKADALGILRGKALDAKIKREKGRLARETDIRKANKLESILNDNIEEKIAEFKKNAYISGNTGETIIDAHGTKLVINLSSKDISAFEKNPSIKALRERCASDPEAAASFNNIAKQCLDSIQSDLNEIEKNNNIKAQLKKDLKEIKEVSFPLEAIKIPKFNDPNMLVDGFELYNGKRMYFKDFETTYKDKSNGNTCHIDYSYFFQIYTI